jgi:hypothetical protein
LRRWSRHFEREHDGREAHSRSGRVIELSRVVIADFIQLVPERFVSVVTGKTHDSPTDPVTAGAQAGTQIRIGAQQRIPGASEALQWTVFIGAFVCPAPARRPMLPCGCPT